MFPTQRRQRQRILEEFEAPLSSVLRETAKEAILYSPLSSINRMGELSEAESGPLDIGGMLRGEGLRGEPDSPLMAADDARKRVAEQGLDLEIPDEGIRERALDILIERKSDERRRRDILNRSPGGFVAGGLQFGVSLGASMLDPLNVAASFVPVVGPARYTSMLSRAATPMARAGVRARVGAIEGAAGAAMVEPLVLGATSQEQADYGLMDSFLNLTLGTVMGGGLHVGGGAIADALSRGRPWQTARATDARGRMVESMSPEVRNAALRTAVAQAVDGRRIDVEPIIAFGRMEGGASGRMEPAMRAGDTAAPVSSFEATATLQRYGYDLAAMREAGEDINSVMRSAPREDAARAYQNQELARIRNDIEDLGSLEPVPNRFAEGMSRTDRAGPDDEVFQRGTRAMSRQERDAEIAKLEAEAAEIDAAIQRGEVTPKARQAVESGRSPQTAGLPDQITRLNASAKASFQPDNYRFSDMEASYRADEQVKNVARPEETRIREELDEAMEDLNRVADALDRGEEVRAVMQQFDDLADTAETYGRAVRAAVDCQLRRGA